MPRIALAGQYGLRCQARLTNVGQAVRRIDDGFDWGSAAIGAGGAGALVVLVSLGAFSYASRNRIQATS